MVGLPHTEVSPFLVPDVMLASGLLKHPICRTARTVSFRQVIDPALIPQSFPDGQIPPGRYPWRRRDAGPRYMPPAANL